jgi:hypothetical protein
MYVHMSTRQGDQIGRTFANKAVGCFWCSFLKITEVGSISSRVIFSTVHTSHICR